MTNVLQVGLGPLGKKIALELEDRRIGRIVAAVDPNPEYAGRPLSEIVEGGPARWERVLVAGSLEEALDHGPVRCAMVTTLSDLPECMETFRALLRRSVAVISTCEELSWPWLRHPIHAQELHELAVRHGGRILGTGVNPGFLMDALPVAATTACQRVDSAAIERVQDASTRRIPFQRKIGATLSLDEFEAKKNEGTLRHVGLGESLHMVAHALGMKIKRWDESIEPIVADEALECDLGPIPAGHARGVRQVARGWSEDRQVLELLFAASIGEPEPRDRVTIEGEPGFELVIPGGIHGDIATSAIAVNSLRGLLAAPAGLHTMAELPLRGCAQPADVSAR